MPRSMVYLLLGLSLTALAPAGSAPTERFRGAKVEWTRLNTGTPYWNRHSEFDGQLLAMMRAYTALDVMSEWRATRPDDMKTLCTYPFIYTDNIAPLSASGVKNLAEYLRRGGFLMIDACGNSTINPSPTKFLDNQLKVLRSQFPDLRVGELKPGHEVFSIYFKMSEFPPRAHPLDGGSWLDEKDFPLYAVFSGDRMIGIISLSGLQCGWAHMSKIPVEVECMKMVTNIYIYAMIR